MRKIETFYDAHAPYYESKFRHPIVSRFKHDEGEAIVAALREWIPAGVKVLELGCGTGMFTEPIARRAGDVTAVDISSGMLEQLKGRLLRAGIENVRVWKSDVEARMPEGPFDAVVGIGVLEYIHDPGRLLAQVQAVLQPGGVVIFTAPRLSLSGTLYFALSAVRKRIAVRLFRHRQVARLVRLANLDLLAIRAAGRVSTFPTPVSAIVVARRSPLRCK